MQNHGYIYKSNNEGKMWRENHKKRFLLIITYNSLEAWDCHLPVFSNDIAVFGRLLFGSCSGERLIDCCVSVGCHRLMLWVGSLATQGTSVWRPRGETKKTSFPRTVNCTFTCVFADSNLQIMHNIPLKVYKITDISWIWK